MVDPGDANQTVEKGRLLTVAVGLGLSRGNRLRLNGRESRDGGWRRADVHDAGRVDECQNGEDDVFGERTPGRANACEPGVNSCQIL